MYTASHFLAGLASGTFTAVLLQPADLLKTRVQQSQSSTLFGTLKAIFAQPAPIKQLWRGTVPSAIRTGGGSALYFGGLNLLRRNAAAAAAAATGTPTSISASSSTSSSSSSSLPQLSKTTNLLTGAAARTGAGFILMPITVIKVRYESSFYNYNSILGASTDILRREGLRGFFAGFGATAVRDAPYAGLYVLFYEESKMWLSSLSEKASSAIPLPAGGAAGGGDNSVGRSLSTAIAPSKSASAAGINFTSGVLAAGAATLITNPFDAIKTRLQLQPARYGNMVKAAKMMLGQEGMRSMFDGLALRMGRKAVSSALAWTVYEELIRRAEDRLAV